MKNHEMVTLLRDDQRLDELEKVIAKGKKTFVEVGLALAEIRDLRLYRREFGGFEEYCQKRWGWTRRYTNYVIAGAEAVRSLPENLGTMVPTERAGRELAKAVPEQRAGIVQAIADEGEPVTADAIKRRIPPVPVGRRGTAGQVPPDESGDESPHFKAARRATPPPAAVVDATGWPVPTQLIPLWQRTDEVQEMLTILSRVKGALRTAQDKRDTLYAEVNFSSALSQLDQAWADLKRARPFAVCPTCQGQLPDKCTLCHGRGIISEHRWNTCVTREDKEFRFRAKARGGTSNIQP